MNAAIQVRVSAQLKQEVDSVLHDIGLDAPTAIRLFLKKVVASRSIPFELRSQRTINGLTPEFEQEVLNAAAENEQIGPFSSAKEAIQALHRESKKCK